MSGFEGIVSLRPAQAVTDNTNASLGEVAGATFDETLASNPSTAYYREKYLENAYAMSPDTVDAPSARQRLKDEGLEGRLQIPDQGIPRFALDTLIYRKREEVKRQDVLSRAPPGIASNSVRLAVGLGGSLLDPLNVAAGFFPVVGEARYAQLLARAPLGIVGRTAVRAGVGAAEGTVGTALIEPIVASSKHADQADYDMADSIANIAFGGVFGAGLHTMAGGASEVFNALRGRVAPWQEIKFKSEDDKARAEALRTEIAAGMDARDVQRTLSTWEPDQRAAFLQNFRATPEPGGAADIAARVAPETRAAALKTAVAQAASGERVNVEPLIKMDPAASTVIDAMAAGQKNNTFTYPDRESQYGRTIGFPQKEGTPTDKLFSNFADVPKPAHMTDVQWAAQRDKFRADMLERAASDTGFEKYTNPVTSTHDFEGGIKAEVTATTKGAPRTRVVLKDGDAVVGAANMHGGMIDSIAVAKEFAGNAYGEKLLSWLHNNRLANVSEVPDRSPGFVAIQKKVLDAATSPAESPPARIDLGQVQDAARQPKLSTVADERASALADRALAEPAPQDDLTRVQQDTADEMTRLKEAGVDTAEELAPYDQAITDAKTYAKAARAAVLCGLAHVA